MLIKGIFQKILLFIAIITSIASPFSGYVILNLIMLFNGARLSRGGRVIYSILLIFCIAGLCAYRQAGLSLFDDFSNSYYPNYLNIYNGDYESFYRFSKIEIGLPILFFGLTKLGFLLSQSELIFILTFISLSIFLVWMEIYGLKFFDERQKTFAIIFCLVTWSFVLPSILVRQYLAIVILLFALVTKLKRNRLIGLIVSSVFHASSLVTFLIFKISLKPLLSSIFLLLLFLFIQTHFLQYISTSYSDFVLLDKINTLPESTDQSLYDFSGIKLTILAYIISLMINFRNPVNKYSCQLLFVIILYFVCLPIPQLSLRTTLIFTQILLGWILLKSIRFAKQETLMSVFLLFFSWKVFWIFTYGANF